MRGKFGLSLALAALFLSGCIRRYDITLNDGTHIVTHHKPKLVDNSVFTWKERGRTNWLDLSRVRQIQALSPWQRAAENPFISEAPSR